MKRFLIGIILVLSTFACNKDKQGPTIIVSESNFCIEPGKDVEFSLEINDEDLKEVNMTAPDLDFIQSYDDQFFKDVNGIVDFIFTIHPDTPSGNYVLGIEAVDNEGNVSTEEVGIKVL